MVKRVDKRKGISTFIATLLLMVLAVAAGIVIYAYTMGYLGGFGGTETLGSMSLDTVSVDTDGNVTAYLRNTGKVELQIGSVYVNGANATDFSSTTIPENTVKLAWVDVNSAGITYSSGVTYSIKIICKDNTQISFSVKG